MNYLARREHSYDELFRKLRQKTFAEPDIHQVLNKLAQEGMLSNARFTENYISFRREKGFGPLRIQAELIARGLSKEFIEGHLNMADNSWLEAARKLWHKRFKGIAPSDFKSKAQQIRFLKYRGFTDEHVRTLIEIDEG